MSRIGVVEGCRLASPVGQGQFRGEEGVVASGRAQDDGDEERREGAVWTYGGVQTTEPGLDGGVILSAQTGVLLKEDALQGHQLEEALRDGAGQLVVGEPKFGEVGEAAQFGRDGTCQLVVVEIQLLKVGEIAELGWDGPRQLVDVERQLPKVGEVADLGGDFPRQLVVGERKLPKVGEIAELGRDVTCQLVAVEPQ